MGLNKPVEFSIAKLLKEKDFDKQCSNFYTNPRCKMFGIDEHSRYYPIKNKAKTLWISGEAATLDSKHVYYAPTIAEVVMWLYEKHGIWIHICYMTDTKNWLWDCYKYKKENGLLNSPEYSHQFNHQSPTEAYEAAIEYTLKNLIS
jgi:hypothetical protein